jgi:uncharacterized protein YerC
VWPIVGCGVPRDVDPAVRADPRVQALCAALAAAGDDEDLILRFLWDLLSARELVNAANRWAAARLLLSGETQATTARTLGLSAKTVIEVDRWTRGLLTAGGFVDVHRRSGAEARGPAKRGARARRSGTT